MRNILLACLFFCSLSLSLIGSPTNYSMDDHKVYISSKSLKVTDHGIFISENGNTTPVDAIYSDSEGIYTTQYQLRENVYRCRNGHDIWHNCGGCTGAGCRFECKCSFPRR